MKIGIVMGSDSDLPVMKEAADFLCELGIEYELTIVSAHRTPKRLYEFAETAADNGFGVIIAGAGGSAHLPGMIAAITTLPVIGIPVKSNALSGVDSLYSIVQMPPGIPVATVAINGAKNAGILAASILSVYDKEIARKLRNYKDGLNSMVHEKINRLEEVGYKNYLKEMGV